MKNSISKINLQHLIYFVLRLYKTSKQFFHFTLNENEFVSRLEPELGLKIIPRNA